MEARPIHPDEFTPRDRKRFLSKIIKDPASGCWLWQGPKNQAGYGLFETCRQYQRRSYLAHRAAYVVIKDRPLDPRLISCHQCRAPACVNPAHIRLADHQRNTDDMVAAGRARFGAMAGVRGDAHPATKHSAAVRMAAVAMYYGERMSHAQIAARIGVHRQTVMRWLHAHVGTLSRSLLRSRPTDSPDRN